MDNKHIVFINEMSVSSICLLCLENNDNLIDISGEEGIDLNIVDIINKHFWFQVNSRFFVVL